MKIIEISIKLGATVNLGDYNNFRPEIGGKAAVEAFDDPDEVFIKLEEQLSEQLAQIVDDELERAGRTPKYASTLYVAKYSDVRRCVVVALATIELPLDRSWLYRDQWYEVNNALPTRMRHGTAHKVATAAAHEKEYPIYYVHERTQLALLPELPDCGPEPAWSSKNLKPRLHQLDVPEDRWLEIGELPRVDNEYLTNLYYWWPRINRWLGRQEILDIILAGGKPWEYAAANADPDEDEDWDDEEE